MDARTTKWAFCAANSSAASRDSPPTLSQYLQGAGSVLANVKGASTMSDVHIDRTFLLEHLPRAHGLVVEDDVRPEGAHELNLLF